MEVANAAHFDYGSLDRAFVLSYPLNAQQIPPGYGEQPKLPAPKESWLPTIKWSVANEPWSKGQTPKPAAALRVAAFAQEPEAPPLAARAPQRRCTCRRGCERAREILVAARDRPEHGAAPLRIDRRECQPHFAACAMPTATASPRNSLYFWKGCVSRSEWRLIGDQLYVANTDSVVRFPTAPATRASPTRAQSCSTCLSATIGHVHCWPARTAPSCS